MAYCYTYLRHTRGTRVPAFFGRLIVVAILTLPFTIFLHRSEAYCGIFLKNASNVTLGSRTIGTGAHVRIEDSRTGMAEDAIFLGKTSLTPVKSRNGSEPYYFYFLKSDRSSVLILNDFEIKSAGFGNDRFETQINTITQEGPTCAVFATINCVRHLGERGQLKSHQKELDIYIYQTQEHSQKFVTFFQRLMKFVASSKQIRDWRVQYANRITILKDHGFQVGHAGSHSGLIEGLRDKKIPAILGFKKGVFAQSILWNVEFLSDRLSYNVGIAATSNSGHAMLATDWIEGVGPLLHDSGTGRMFVMPEAHFFSYLTDHTFVWSL